VYITVKRASLSIPEDLTPAVDVVLQLRQGELIKLADKVRFMAPAQDSSHSFIQLLRYPIAEGRYTLSFEVYDAYAAGQLPLKLSTQVYVQGLRSELQLSDIQLASVSSSSDSTATPNELAKHGRRLEPLVDNLVGSQQFGFLAYVEAYAPAKLLGQPALLEYTLVSLKKGSTDGEQLFRKTRRFTPSAFATPFFIDLKTELLPSGRYALEMRLRNRALQSFGEKASIITVVNPRRDARDLANSKAGYADSWVQEISSDTLEYVLKAILPTLPNTETESLNTLLQDGKEEDMRLAVFNHFLGESAMYPDEAYHAFLKVAREVDFAFQSGFGHGFQTDRGHIFMKYGLPDDRVIVNDDPSAPPYEIWVYNFVERTQQSPGKFLFYNTTLDNANYVLLHSTVRGEILEPQWRRYLYSRSAGELGDESSPESTDVLDNVGRYADAYFEDF